MEIKHQGCQVGGPEFDGFCIKEQCCPEKLATPKFPSASSCLPEQAQRELEERIEIVNQLLLDLALSGEQPEEARRKIFDRLVGQFVHVKLNDSVVPFGMKRKNINSKKKRLKKKQQKRLSKQVEGFVHLVGWDFIDLKNKQEHLLIPYKNISFIKSPQYYCPALQAQGLHDIDLRLRRALMFNFGQTVASSPELIQTFFRLRLTNFLLLLIDQNVQLVTEGKTVKGIVSEVRKETITICIRDNKYQEIPLTRISCLVVEDGDKRC